MPVETERKYLHPDLNLVRKSLSDRGAAYRDWVWEENMVLDTLERSLRSQNMLLRLRHTGSTRLTLKKIPLPAPAHPDLVKTMEEWETLVEDKAAMLAILKHLGFVLSFKYEKIRETWQWGKCAICLDILPFMEAVEIEGELFDIDQTALHFGLDGLETSTMTYHQLFQRHRESLGLAPMDDFVFSEEQKNQLRKQPTVQGK